MKVKRIAALASLSALIFSVGPAVAATGTVTVKWNTQKSAAIKLYTQTDGGSQTSTSPAATDQYAAVNGGSGICNNGATKDGGGGNGAWATGVVNFGNVTPDGVQYTDCLEINAVEAYVTTNDGSGVNVTVQAAGVPVGYDVNGAGGSLLCVYKDGTWNTGAATTFGLSALSAAVVNTATNACASSGIAVTSASAATLNNSTVAATQDLNSDMELVLGPNATVGATSATLTYTATAN